jgi:hypothetical protein
MFDWPSFKNTSTSEISRIIERYPLGRRQLEWAIEALPERTDENAKCTLERARQLLAELPKEPLIPHDDKFGFLDVYQSLLSKVEWDYISQSPLELDSNVGVSIHDPSYTFRISRISEHTMVPYVRKELVTRGTNLIHNSDSYGMALRLAAFELRWTLFLGWHGFALLMFKMLGAEVVPWIASLYLAAYALERPDDLAGIELDEVLSFAKDYQS